MILSKSSLRGLAQYIGTLLKENEVKEGPQVILELPNLGASFQWNIPMPCRLLMWWRNCHVIKLFKKYFLKYIFSKNRK